MRTTHLTAPDPTLAALLRRLRKHIDDADEAFDEIELWLVDHGLAHEIRRGPALRSAPGGVRVATTRPSPARAQVRSLDFQRALELEAERGATALKFERQPDGRAHVTINGNGVRLPNTLAQILLILASDTGSSDDHLVGWKSTRDIAALMARRRSGTYRPHAVSEAVRRLRAHLRDEGINWLFVQTHGTTRKLRFAIPPAAAPRLVSPDADL